MITALTIFALSSVGLVDPLPKEIREMWPPPAEDFPAIIESVGPSQVLDGFVKDVAAGPFDAAAQKIVSERRAALKPDEYRDFLGTCMAVLSPQFKQGLELIETDQTAQAADVFERLSHDADPFVAVTSAQLAATTLLQLEQVERCQRMLQRVMAEHRPIGRFSLCTDHLQFILGYCQVHTLHYEAAEATLKDFLARYPAASEKLRVTAAQILTELNRRAPGQLGDVRDLMAYAGRRIKRGEIDRPVLQRQTEAVELLGRLIEESEDQEKQSSSGSSKGGGKKGGSKAGGKQPGQGSRRSMLPTGDARDAELRKTRATPGEAWGKMPPREREQVLQSLQREFPGRYRELLEQYYQQLAKDKPER